LIPSTTYSIVIRALDAEQNFTNSTALSVTTTANSGDTVKPSAPTNVTSSSITTTGFRINWTAATDNVGVTGYNIYRNGSYLATVSSTTTNYTFSGLTAATTYSVYVRALDAVKNFTNSTTLSVTTLAAGDTTAPSAPTNVASSNMSKTGFRISWTAATDNVAVANYNIYRNGTYLATVSGTATSYNFSGLTAGTTYSVYVRALDAAKNFTNSTPLSVTTLP
jgi:chitodextrinase